MTSLAEDVTTTENVPLASQSPLKILPVELPVRPWPFAIFTLKDRTLSPAVDRFIADLRDFARSM